MTRCPVKYVSVAVVIHERVKSQLLKDGFKELEFYVSEEIAL